MDVTVSPATEDEVRSGFVGRQLREFNYKHVGEYPEVQAVRLNARSSEGQVVGGLRAIVAMHWLRVEVLWVHESCRRMGIGSRMLMEAERMAIELGARSSAVETFEWQAPGFYEKHGYVETGRFERYINNYYLALMRKPL
jgi:ribosomal protein S18 acetylase RimI-like enzyme